MGNLQLKRISCDHPDALEGLRRLRKQLSSHADVISEKGRQLTEAVFGEPLSPVRVVERVCKDVQQNGLEALLRYSEHFDKRKLDATTFRVSAEELQRAHESVTPDYLAVLRRVSQNILSFQSGLLSSDAVLHAPDKHELKMRFRPMRRIGICVPGGAAAYPSTLLMTVCPARAAGVKEIVVVLPPTEFGGYNTDLLAACHELGVREVYRVGGAQAVAAMAYGVEGMEPVDMIVGPGNIFVTLAKKYVFGEVDIDCLAGPSEVVVIADETVPASFVAADLIAQAEHDPGTSILITWHEPLLDEVIAELEQQLDSLERSDATRRCLEEFGAMVLVKDRNEAARITDQIGPEHLHIECRDAAALSDQIDNAGAIFLGPYTPVALGDYAAGPSHVLPTGGTVRFASGLSAPDFVRRTSVIQFTPRGLAELSHDVQYLANKEGLTGHRDSVEIRLRTAARQASEMQVARNGAADPRVISTDEG
ncbi:MAG: histidinol dehydrogenase [Gemmataceae bacterium]